MTLKVLKSKEYDKLTGVNRLQCTFQDFRDKVFFFFCCTVSSPLRTVFSVLRTVSTFSCKSSPFHVWLTYVRHSYNVSTSARTVLFSPAMFPWLPVVSASLFVAVSPAKSTWLPYCCSSLPAASLFGLVQSVVCLHPGNFFL